MGSTVAVAGPEIEAIMTIARFSMSKRMTVSSSVRRRNDEGIRAHVDRLRWVG